ncbi:hypothetical protein PTSG_12886 [Salpingoeca rosetta]|uniref:Methyltransferase domain-containing protein n=1 Tax=Salpingoeca rosetta (strain ATCC 50818 / BSB-021) TaxID=946362 RepID=F2UMN4_SALR5|nr:uncharacterized protein PTSG_12886 [Salpingoeca rosetta]EGD78383.1 hypothetical protein PTSG_12886 [Salpingoeca rosetta]|eukprot:XP_004989706.1 hypothetical protein PTSG_12886 [Salpingoeca rosetta]
MLQTIGRVKKTKWLAPVTSFAVGSVLLPERWIAAAETAIANSGASQAQVFEDASKFHAFWANRDMPDIELPEASSVRDRAYVSEDGVKYKNHLRYGEREALAFLVSQAPHTFASTHRVLNELRIRDPAFQPSSVLDFGAGTGTSTWALHDTWKSSVDSITCVDTSLAMLNLSQHMLEGIDYDRHSRFQQFLSPKGEHDLVLASHTLSELPSGDARRAALTSLWNKTTSYLVLVENGSAWGHMCMLEARQHIAALALHDNQAHLEAIHSSDDEDTAGPSAHDGPGSDAAATAAATREEEEEEEGHQRHHDGDGDGQEQGVAFASTAAAASTAPYTMQLVAPCPHMYQCPMTQTSHPCHFPVSVVWPPSLMFHRSLRRRQVRRSKFSYLILKKTTYSADQWQQYRTHIKTCGETFAAEQDKEQRERKRQRQQASAAAAGEEEASADNHPQPQGQHHHHHRGADNTLAAMAAYAGTVASGALGAAHTIDSRTPAAVAAAEAKEKDDDEEEEDEEDDDEEEKEEDEQKEEEEEEQDAASDSTSSTTHNRQVDAEGDCPTPTAVDQQLHRVVASVSRKKGLVTARTCSFSGKIRDVTFSKRRVNDDLKWRAAKKMAWGDLVAANR